MRQGLKLNEQQVAEIKKALEKPWRGQQKSLAAKYNVSRNIIGEIARGNIYKNDELKGCEPCVFDSSTADHARQI